MMAKHPGTGNRVQLIDWFKWHEICLEVTTYCTSSRKRNRTRHLVLVGGFHSQNCQNVLNFQRLGCIQSGLLLPYVIAERSDVTFWYGRDKTGISFSGPFRLCHASAGSLYFSGIFLYLEEYVACIRVDCSHFGYVQLTLPHTAIDWFIVFLKYSYIHHNPITSKALFTPMFPITSLHNISILILFQMTMQLQHRVRYLFFITTLLVLHHISALTPLFDCWALYIASSFESIYLAGEPSHPFSQSFSSLESREIWPHLYDPYRYRLSTEGRSNIVFVRSWFL